MDSVNFIRGIISREVARLKMKGKGDVLPISIEDEKEVEEVTCAVCNKVYRSKAYLSLHMRSHETGNFVNIFSINMQLGVVDF